MFPNLVIGGAPKCGTSSLYRWLSDHPRACRTGTKEPFYLMDRNNPLAAPNNFWTDGLDAYGSLFGPPGGSELVIDGTTHYLYQDTAPTVLASLPEVPLAVFLVRDPAERVFSSFQFSKHLLHAVRPEVTFSEFVDAVQNSPDRLQEMFLSDRSAFVLTRDISYGHYVNWLRVWRDRVGRDRIRVLDYQRLVADPESVVRELLGALNISDDYLDGYVFGVENETRPPRSRRVHQVASAVVSRLPRSGRSMQLRSVYSRVLRADRPATTDSDIQAIRQLQVEFRESNVELADEFSIDTSSWCRR